LDLSPAQASQRNRRQLFSARRQKTGGSLTGTGAGGVSCWGIDTLYSQGIKVSLGGTIHDPSDPFGRFFLGTLSLMAEFETDLLRARTREGMAIARSKRKLKGKPPKLTPNQAAHLRQLYAAGDHTSTELAEIFQVARSTIYRILDRP
jgi:DNA invertase Pin-like site-specific DNA recombinase